MENALIVDLVLKLILALYNVSVLLVTTSSMESAEYALLVRPTTPSLNFAKSTVLLTVDMTRSLENVSAKLVTTWISSITSALLLALKVKCSTKEPADALI